MHGNPLVSLTDKSVTHQNSMDFLDALLEKTASISALEVFKDSVEKGVYLDYSSYIREVFNKMNLLIQELSDNLIERGLPLDEAIEIYVKLINRLEMLVVENAVINFDQVAKLSEAGLSSNCSELMLSGIPVTMIVIGPVAYSGFSRRDINGVVDTAKRTVSTKLFLNCFNRLKDEVLNFFF